MLKTAGYYIKIYWLLATQDIKGKMQFKTDFWLSSIGILISNLTGVLMFWVLFRSINSLAGWTMYEMLFMYSFSLLALTPAQIFFENLWNLSGNIISGNFIKYCFRPLDIFFFYIAEIVDVKGFSQFIVGLSGLWYSGHRLGLSLSPLQWLLLPLVLLSASLIMISLSVFASSFCFWIMDASAPMIFVNKFRDYAKYPLTIYNRFFKYVFTFLLPIGYIGYYPSLLFLRSDSFTVLTLISPFVGLLFFGASYRFWSYGAKKYSGTGS